ncbi:hypothetical protein ACFYZN_08885 [Streptomyces sp. NPDC001777]|uniref:hypothetical protein n=1 Tax=Streptomyces sp. NPDC001777 TaxID=3364608 RepID=UPI00369F1768
MPFGHIAHVLGVTVPAAKKYAGRARRRLAPSRTPPNGPVGRTGSRFAPAAPATTA